MAHGLPVVSAFADGSAEDLVVDGINGYILRNSRAEEIASRLKSILGDPAKRYRMGAVSREFITTKYSFAAFIDRILKGLNKVSGDVKHAVPFQAVRSLVLEPNP